MLLRVATEVHTASSGKKALEFLDRDSGKDIDLIFADIMMPEVRIDELKRVLKKNEKLKEVPVIVMSTVANLNQTVIPGKRGWRQRERKRERFGERVWRSLQQHQQHTTTTTTRSSKRLKTNNNNNNTPQGKTNSSEVEVLQKPLSFRRVENVVYSHKRLLRSHNSSSSKLIRRNKINDKTMGRKQILKRLALIQARRKKLLGEKRKKVPPAVREVAPGTVLAALVQLP